MDEQEQLAVLEQNRETLRLSYREIFLTEEGERVLEDLRTRCHSYAPSFEADPYVTAYNEGQRSTVLFIEQMLKDPPKQTEGE